jgi:hypothetical protein
MKWSNGLLILVLLGFGSRPSGAQNWTSLPFRFNFNDVRYIVDTSENVMYFGGGFDSVNSISTRIVKWDGTNITYLNTSFGATDVRTYQNRLYINASGIVFRYDTATWTQLNNGYCFWGKSFFPAGDKLLVGLFRTDPVTGAESTPMGVWDGTSLKDTLGLDTLWKGKLWGFNSLAWYKGELYMGGFMYPEGHPLINLIARFDGQRWKDVGGGISAGGFAHINELLVWKGDLYVAGQFLESAGAPGNCIARWDGYKWYRLGNGVYKGSGGESDIQKMVVYKDELYVAGFFDQADGISAPGVAKWDGKKWCSVKDNFDGWSVQELAVYKDELYIGGGWSSINGDTSFNHLAKYTGSGFSDCSTPLAARNSAGASGSTIIYPNPSSDRLFVQEAAWVDTISIFDFTGRLVVTLSYDTNGVDISELVSGVYAVRVQGRGVFTTVKLIKR